MIRFRGSNRRGTYSALVDQGVTAELALVEGALYICDLRGDLESEGWKAAFKGYDLFGSCI